MNRHSPKIHNSMSYKRLSILIAIVSFILLAGCHNPQGKSETESIKLDEQTISSFATSIINGLHNGNANALNDVIDKKKIKELISDNSIVYSGFDVEGGKEYFERCLKLGDQAVQTLNNGGDYTFVKYYEKKGEHHIVMRSYDNYNLNFQDFVVDSVHGKLMIEDGFIYNIGCNLSKSVKYGMLYNLMLQTNPEADIRWMQEAEELTVKGNHAKSLSILNEHKDALKEYPIFHQLWIANSFKTDSKNFISILDNLKDEGVDNRYLLLHKLLYYFNEGKLAETEQTINELIPHTGDDPIYLLFYGKANIYAKQYKDAMTIFHTAEESMPLIWDLWYSELQCFKRLNDTKGYEKCLQKGKEAYGMSEQELRNLKVD